METARYVSFASAGTRGIVYMGLLDALEDYLGKEYEAWRAALHGAAGTSAGACAALLLLLGLDREARRETLLELSDVRAVVRSPDIALLFRRYGCEDGSAFKELVQRILMRGGLSANSTLGDLKRLLRQDFVCVCTDLRSGKPLTLSAETAPTLRVCDALYASCCVPFVFSPAQLPDGTVAVDGCLSCDLPEVFVEEETLFVTMQESEEGVVPLKKENSGGVQSWGEFLHGIVQCSSVAQRHRVQRLLERDRCFLLPLPPTLSRMPVFDVHQGPEETEALFRCGYALTCDRLYGGRVSLLAGRMVELLVKRRDATPPEELPPPSVAAAADADGPDSS